MASSKTSLLTKVHALKRTLTEVAWYPPHAPRKYYGSKFKAVEDLLTKKLNLPCLVCGVQHSTLKRPSVNKYGAKQMEAHHRVIEWSLSNAIDPMKFNRRVRPRLLHTGRDPAFRHLYRRDMSVKEIHDWIDHSTDNLWVLCDVHHRGKRHGIHSITGPIWGPQDLLTDAFLQEAEQRSHVLETRPLSTRSRVSAVGRRSRRQAYRAPSRQSGARRIARRRS